MQPKVLIVDDQPAVVKAWEAVLAGSGIGVTGSRNGKEAWDKFQETIFDAVITDIKMPGMDGIELAKRIKEKDKRTEVIFFTGYGSPEFIESARKLGIEQFILKPVTPATMADVTITALKKRGFLLDQFTLSWKWLARPPEVAAKMMEEAKKMVEVPSAAKITMEHLEKVDEIAAGYKNMPGGLIPALQKVQNLIGYLPPIVQKKIATRMDIPLSEVFGVVTFYSFFTMVPRGRHVCRICLGTACYVMGGKEIAAKLCQNLNVELGHTTDDMRFTIEAVRCLGACGLAPAITIDGRVYGRNKPDKVLDILEKYK